LKAARTGTAYPSGAPGLLTYLLSPCYASWHIGQGPGLTPGI